MLSKTDLIRWIERQRREVTSLGGTERFDLYHTVSGSPPERLETFPATEHTAEELAEILDTSARVDASTRRGGTPERYQVTAYRETDLENAASSFAWLVEPVYIPQVDSGQPSDPPTPAGLQAQQMRHVEKLIHLLTVQGATSVQFLTDDANRERRRRLETELELEELKRRVGDDNSPINALASVIVQVLPILIGQLMPPESKSVPALPKPKVETALPEFDALLSLIGNLTSDEVMRIVPHLTQPHQLGLFELKKAIESGTDRAMLKVSAAETLKSLSPQELQAIVSNLNPPNAQAFIEICKGLSQ